MSDSTSPERAPALDNACSVNQMAETAMSSTEGDPLPDGLRTATYTQAGDALGALAQSKWLLCTCGATIETRTHRAGCVNGSPTRPQRF